MGQSDESEIEQQMGKEPEDESVAGQTGKFQFIVTVECATREEAETVMTERIGFDEDYGFDYTIDWDDCPEPDGSHQSQCLTPQEKMVPFGELDPARKRELEEALAAGRVEVHCPWWPDGHWELKSPKNNDGGPATLFDEAFYRIAESG